MKNIYEFRAETQGLLINFKSNLFHYVCTPGNSGLTEFAVRKHEVMYGVKAQPGASATETSDDQSTVGTSLPGTFKTFDTFASDWTNCTNISFNK